MLLRRVSASFSAQLWSLSLTLGDRIVLVGILLRSWGADVYGDWVTLLATAGLISMGEMGLNIYFGNKWQQAYAQQNETEFQRFIGISLSTYFILGMGLGALAVWFVLCNDLTQVLSLQVFNTQSAVYVFLLLSGMQSLRVMRASISQIYRGRNQFAAGILTSSIVSFSTIILAGIAALLDAGPLIIAVIYLLCDLVAGWGIMLFDLRCRFPQLRFRLERPTCLELKHMLGHGKWYGFLQGAPVAWLQVPVLVIGILGLGGATLVSFLLPRTVVNFARQVTEMLSRSVAVETAATFHLGDKTRLTSTLSAFGTFLSGLTGAIVGGLMLFGAPVIAFWSGKPELFDPWIFFWLLAPSALIAPALPLKNILILGNFPRPVGMASLMQILLGLPFCYGLARSYGIAGAAAGLAVGEALALGVYLPLTGYHHICKGYLRYFVGCLSVFIIASSWCYFAAWVILYAIGARSFMNFVISGILWGLIGFLPALIIAVPPDKRTNLLNKGLGWVQSMQNHP